MKKYLKCTLILLLLTCVSASEPFCYDYMDQVASRTFDITYKLAYHILFPFVFGIVFAFFLLCIKNKQEHTKIYLLFLVINIVLCILAFHFYWKICTYNLILVGVFGANFFLNLKNKSKE